MVINPDGTWTMTDGDIEAYNRLRPRTLRKCKGDLAKIAQYVNRNRLRHERAAFMEEKAYFDLRDNDPEAFVEMFGDAPFLDLPYTDPSLSASA